MTGICRHCDERWERPHRSRARFCPKGPCQTAALLFACDRKLARSQRYEARRRGELPPVADEIAAERAKRVLVYAARAERGERLFA